ncbi:hypothetical protein DL767_008325 [Monosporascus sp. MG133]|nr:hypothetical protein DL767_008325 [Monosporascus sp. MG133]
MATDSPPIYTDTPPPVLSTPHSTFHGGTERMKVYLEKERVEFQPAELIAILDSFKDASPIAILGIADAAGRKQVNLGFVLNILPVFLLTMDTADFEQGMWHESLPHSRESPNGS